jgi:hypothetical protein
MVQVKGLLKVSVQLEHYWQQKLLGRVYPQSADFVISRIGAMSAKHMRLSVHGNSRLEEAVFCA